MWRSLLVPVDGSSFGEHALPLALSIVRRTKACLHITLVHEPDTSVESLSLADTLDREHRKKEAAYLHDLRERIQSVGENVEVHHCTGLISDTIEHEAQTRDVDLVVMSSHGRGALSRLWLGSKADELIRRLTIPILVVRPQDHSVLLDSDRPIRHVLVPLDGSHHAEAILEGAVTISKMMGSELTLLRVVSALDPGATELAVEIESQAAQYLQGVAERLRTRCSKVQTLVVAGTSPATVILDVARQLDCDMIALATRGHGGLRRLLLGSVADKVVRAASVPLLILRAFE